MRLIAGTAGSRPLKVPKSVTRPTTDRVREAIFSSLGPRVVGASVLDLFAGSGALGLEALSRGAEKADFVDSSADAIRTIGENARSCDFDAFATHQRDVFSFARTLPSDAYDLIFADPPYARDEATAAVVAALLAAESLVASLREGGILVLESFAAAPLPPTSLWRVEKEKRYGQTRVSYLIPN